jgi:Mce-associated membrane protein
VTLSDDVSRLDAPTGAIAAPPPPEPSATAVREPVWRAPRAVLIALSALVVILAGVVIWLWLLVMDQHSRNDNRDAAQTTARRVATDFATYDYNTVDAQFARMSAESTGAMKAQVQQSQQSVVPLIKAAKAKATGTVRDSAVVLSHGNQISVIAVVDETVSNSAVPNGSLKRYRFLLVMQKVHGHWLLANLEQA